MPRLSAIIIAKNEAQNIEECLDSVAFCDERIVVIDTASIDETAQRAEMKGARVTRHDFQGFGAQKSFALAQAQGDWVLSIDADERVSAALAAEVRAAMANDAVDGFEMPRRSRFCGRVNAPLRLVSGLCLAAFPACGGRVFRKTSCTSG